MFHGRVMPLVVVPLLLVALSSCSEGAPTPKPLASSTSTTSPASTPGPSTSASAPAAGTLPPEARTGARTKASAEAFMERYIQAFNAATATGETAVLAAMGDGTCESCSAASGRVERLYDRGGHISSAGWTLKRMAIAMTPGGAKVSVDINLSPQVVIERANSPTTRYKGGQISTTFLLSFRQSRWLVDEIERSQ